MRAHGRALVWGPKRGDRVERDFVSCTHCQAVIELQPGLGRTAPAAPSGEAAWCDQCGAWVCPTEACASVCVPFIKQVEKQISDQYHREQFARMAGIQEGVK